MTLAEPRVRPWTRSEYYDAAARGWFQGQRVELIAGEVIQMPAMGLPHVKTVTLIERMMIRLFEPQAWVRSQAPLSIGAASDPEPDISVVAGSMNDYAAHPTTALLVIEVADTTLRHDRAKAALYASAGVRDYWIVNLVESHVEVHRDPHPDPANPLAGHYASKQVLAWDATIRPVARPDVSIRAADLFPE